MAKDKSPEWLTKDGLTLLRGWARKGLTKAEIAKKMGVARSTLILYESKHSVISDALKRTKEITIEETVDKLMEAMGGYFVNEVVEITKKDAKGNVVSTEEKETKRYIPYNVTAIFGYLNNKEPDEWQNKTTKIKEIERLAKEKLEVEIEKLKSSDEADSGILQQIIEAVKGAE